ncbi:MAG: four helix bundle protein [Nitrospira sp.]|nr:four helix bundle protein [Nitrospira sp.]
MAKGEWGSPKDLKARTQELALRVIRLTRALPSSPEGWVLGKQVLRSGTAVGANYRSCQRGKSKADFIAKLAVAEEEADETCYWLELIIGAELLPRERVEPILREAMEITAILTAAGKTAKENREK